MDIDFKEYFNMKAQDLKKARVTKAPYLSKKEFAELAGVDQASICRWERGKIPKSSGIFRRYLIFLGLLEPSEEEFYDIARVRRLIENTNGGE